VGQLGQTIACPERLKLLQKCATLQVDAVLSGRPSDLIAAEMALQALEAHTKEHGCSVRFDQLPGVASLPA
jgi:hypothetical protein